MMKKFSYAMDASFNPDFAYGVITVQHTETSVEITVDMETRELITSLRSTCKGHCGFCRCCNFDLSGTEMASEEPCWSPCTSR